MSNNNQLVVNGDTVNSTTSLLTRFHHFTGFSGQLGFAGWVGSQLSQTYVLYQEHMAVQAIFTYIPGGQSAIAQAIAYRLGYQAASVTLPIAGITGAVGGVGIMLVGRYVVMPLCQQAYRAGVSYYQTPALEQLEVAATQEQADPQVIQERVDVHAIEEQQDTMTADADGDSRAIDDIIDEFVIVPVSEDGQEQPCTVPSVSSMFSTLTSYATALLNPRRTLINSALANDTTRQAPQEPRINV